MSEEKKTHYRKVFKSDHLGVADLEEYLEDGRSLVFTIKNVVQYETVPGVKKTGVLVAGQYISANIAYFTDPKVKPLVINAKNSKPLRKFAGGTPFIDDWNNIIVELYIDPDVKLKGETTGGVRIRPVQPKKTKEALTPESKKWEAAKEKVKSGDATFESLNKHYLITKENYELLCS